MLALDDALKQLQQRDPQQSRIVELRFFAGLTVEETATVLNISPATVKRDWSMARAWLWRRIKRGEGGKKQWEKIKELLGPHWNANSERAAFLQAACGTDMSLRQEVESLVQGPRIQQQPLATPAPAPALRSRKAGSSARISC